MGGKVPRVSSSSLLVLSESVLSLRRSLSYSKEFYSSMARSKGSTSASFYFGFENIVELLTVL